MQIIHRLMLTVIGITLFTHQVIAEEPQKKPSAEAEDYEQIFYDMAKENKHSTKKAPEFPVASLLEFFALVKEDPASAANFSKAAVALGSFGQSMELTVVPAVMEGLTTTTENGASMVDQFDPLGTKSALAIIQQQNEKIQALQQAEIERLKAELERLTAKKAKPNKK